MFLHSTPMVVSFDVNSAVNRDLCEIISQNDDFKMILEYIENNNLSIFLT